MLSEELVTYVRARYTLVYVLSAEEQRVVDDIGAFAKKEGKKLVVWSFARGARGAGVQTGAAQGDPPGMLEAIRTAPDNTLFVLLDLHPFLDDPGIVRGLKELAMELESTKKTLLLLSPVLKVPVELQKDIVVVDFPLPDAALLRETFLEIANSGSGKVKVVLAEAEVDKLIRSAQGLTLKEFSNVLAKTLVTHGRIDQDAIDIVNAEKKQVIRKSGILDFYPATESFRSVGGLERLKAWLDSRGRAFGEAARTFGLPWPKGILIVGVQGCGKSLTAKAVADSWRMPLLKMDMGRVFGGLVGASEENMRRAIQLAESIAPGVLWIDEIEKGLSGLGSSNMTDGGTTARVIGTFLTWMQEKEKPVFVVATSNDITSLPPELLRKGRFDEIFFVDLPSQTERKQIFEIHLKKRGRDPAAHALDDLAEATRGYSGAEIEEIVVSGMFKAFEKGRELTTEDMLASVRETLSLSVVMEEKIGALREWARMRTRPASVESLITEDQKASIAERLHRIASNN